MDYRLEVIAIPVSDLDRATAFYADRVGFHLDHEVRPTDEMRIIRLTPPGSACSVVLGTGPPLPEAAPGSVRGLQLVVPDLDAARAERGVPIGEIRQLGPVDSPGSRFAFFSDPDGNGWAVLEIRD